jgi:hypothetical protein
MKLVFNDSQYIEVQGITQAERSITINLINTCYETLKHLFTDPVATCKMTLDDGTVYENYTVFSYIKEGCGGIFHVEMFQEGKDTKTALKDLEEGQTMNEQQITDARIALCEIYEMILGGI